MAAGPLRDPLQNLQIVDQRILVDDVDTGVRSPGSVWYSRSIPAYSTVTGCSSTTQGRPYQFSISMKGSGSISSRL